MIDWIRAASFDLVMLALAIVVLAMAYRVAVILLGDDDFGI